MSRENEFDRTLARWLDTEAPSAAPADVLQGALRATRRGRPRPMPFAALGSHWVGNGVGGTSGASTGGRAWLRASAALVILLIALGLLAAGVMVGARLLQPAPAGGSLSLAYGVDGDVFLAEADGSGGIRIADGDPREEPCAVAGLPRYLVHGTAWSPDGRHLAFWDWRPGISCSGAGEAWGDVIVSDVDGNVVGRFPGQGWAIAWSPDSTRIAVLDNWGFEPDEDLTIGLYGSDGTRLRTLTVPSERKPASGDYSAAWSRDGSAIMLPGLRVPIDGGDITPSAESGSYTGCCAYSPDGSLWAAVDLDALILEESDTPAAEQLGPIEFSSLAWSPDGTRVAWERITDIVEGNHPILVVRDVAAGTDTPIVEVGQSDRVEVVDFSPDGERILFLRFDAVEGPGSLWSIGVDGSDARRLLDGIDWADLRPGY